MPSCSCQRDRLFSLSARLIVVVNPRNRSISSLSLSVDEISSQYCKALFARPVRISVVTPLQGQKNDLEKTKSQKGVIVEVYGRGFSQVGGHMCEQFLP